MNRFAAAVVLALCAGCANPLSTEPVAPTIELRAFDVPPEHAERLASTLNHLLMGSSETPIGRVRSGPGGTLLVAAPASVIAGMMPVITAVTTATPPPAPANLSVTYWLVEGTEGEPGHDPRLDGVASTLAAIVEADGPQYFDLLGSERITSLEGESAEATTLSDGNETWFMQRITRDPNSGAFVGEIQLREEQTFGRIQTQIALKPDQTAVLAATGSSSGSLYILVRPQLL